MPCIDAVAEHLDQQEKFENMARDNATLLSVICQTDLAMTGVKEYEEFLAKNNAVYAVVMEHRTFDEDRWFKKYKDTFPDFTSKQIAFMVRAGLLAD